MAQLKHLCMQCMHEIDRREMTCPYCGYAVSSKQPKPYLPHGVILGGRYLVGKMIKRNIDSAIYIGSDIQLDKTVEIREFFPASISAREGNMLFVTANEDCAELYGEYLQSFIRLWRNLMRFKGLPALFDVSEVFEENGTAYAVTDHNDSTTFRKILDTMDIENNPFSLKRTKTLITSILTTVESLHTANVVHRGISPETLILASDGTLRITGFAIAQVRTTKNKVINTVYDGYAAIEQYDFNWQQGSWTDIYAIGAIIYKLLTGRTLPPAPSRLNDDEVFFTQEETERIPEDVRKLIEGCLVMMPQGRIKDVREIINVFSPQFTATKTVSAVRSRVSAVQPLREREKGEPSVETVRRREITAAESKAAENGQPKTEKSTKETKSDAIVKPRQAEAVTKTSLPKPVFTSEEQRRRELQEAEKERKRREEMYRELQEAQAKARMEAEKRRLQREEEIKERNREKRRKRFEGIPGGQAAQNAIQREEKRAEKVSKKLEKRNKRKNNPVLIGTLVAALVSVSCILITFLTYGTVLYKYIDAPVLDNILSHVSVLPVNSQESGENVKYVEVADFRNLTREYIENDALYNRKYSIVFEYDYCDTVEAGYVYSQSVSPGNSVRQGDTVIVYISKGIEMLEFINVSGMQYSEAESALKAIGFTVSKKEVYNIGIYTQDKVISSTLTAGEKYPRGTEVTLSVWGAPPVTLPSTTAPADTQPQQGQTPGRSGDGGLFSFLEDIFSF